jgi:hypothetical protein
MSKYQRCVVSREVKVRTVPPVAVPRMVVSSIDPGEEPPVTSTAELEVLGAQEKV